MEEEEEEEEEEEKEFVKPFGNSVSNGVGVVLGGGKDSGRMVVAGLLAPPAG